MGLDYNSVQSFGVQPNVSNFSINPLAPKVAPRKLSFAQQPDSLSKNSDIDKYLNEKAIVNMVKANPNIDKILSDSNLPVRINMKVLNELKANHLADTKKVVLGIISNLPQDFRSSIDFRPVIKAAPLHDIGKVLIPENIINKQGALADNEFNIMQKHSTLGYEMLRTTDVDVVTLDLIKHHHQNAQKTGYPEVEDNFVSDLNHQILSVADKYSALREKRSYKPELSKNQALSIIHTEVKSGKVHPYIFKALVDYANKEVDLTNLNSQRQVVKSKPVKSLSA